MSNRTNRNCLLLSRYFFLVFNFNERVAVTRENCKILLTRLNMDGYAIGKNKVFLKYYHVEYLTKLYEDTVSTYTLYFRRLFK